MSTKAEYDGTFAKADELTPEQIEAQEEADFEAAFAGEESEAEPAQESEPEAKSEERPRDEKGRFVARSEAEEDDETDDEPPAAEEPPEAKGEAHEADPDEDRVDRRLRRLEGRFGSLNSDIQRILSTTQELQAALQARQEQRKSGGDAPSKDEITEAQKDPEKWAELREEYPDWAEGMDARIAAETDRLRKELAPREALKGFVSREDHEREIQRVREEALDLMDLTVAHPGWRQEVKKPEFVAWVQQDPERIQLTQSMDVHDSIDLLDRWKEFRQNMELGQTREREEAQQRAQSRLRRSVPATLGAGASDIDRTPTEEEDFLAGFNGH